jgi:hypothetical protein
MICWIVRIGGCIHLRIGNIGKKYDGEEEEEIEDGLCVFNWLCMYVKDR